MTVSLTSNFEVQNLPFHQQTMLAIQTTCKWVYSVNAIRSESRSARGVVVALECSDWIIPIDRLSLLAIQIA